MRAVVAKNLEGRGIKLHPTTNLTEVLSDWIFWFLVLFDVIDISIYYKPNWDNDMVMQLVRTENGIKVCTDHGEELIADVVLFATGNFKSFPIRL